MQFGISQVRSDSSLSADIHYELRDCTSVSSGVSTRAVKTVSGVIASASSLYSPGSYVPRKYVPSTGYCFQETIKENAAPCVPPSFPGNSSAKSEPVSSTGLRRDKRYSRFNYEKESASPTGPGKYTKCGRRSVGAGVLHGVEIPWSSLDELINQSLEDECMPEYPAPQVVRVIILAMVGKCIGISFCNPCLGFLSNHIICTPLLLQRCEPDTSNYLCRVKPTGQITFELVEEKKQANSLVQRTLGVDNVLKVAFDAEVGEDGKSVPLTQAQYSMYCRIAKNGIFVGCRRYQYFAHKASDKFEKKMEGSVKCFFVCTDSRGEVDLRNPYFRRFNSIAEARTLFMHIHQTESIAKYIARMQLILSKTMTIDLDWTKVVVREKMDLQCKDGFDQDLDGISTDGTGFISTNLARMIPTSILNGRQKTEHDRNEDYPSLSQVRVLYEGAAYKGTLLASEALPPNTIKPYKSMKKVGRDDEIVIPSMNSLEVVSTSQKPRKLQGVYTAKLSRDLIILLTTCGVPGSFFIDLVKAAIENNHVIFSDHNVAMNEVLEWETEKTEILLMMINARIPLNEPFLHKSLLDIVKRKLEDFTTGKVNLPESFYLMGTADPTGTLKRNQVAIVLSDGLVYCPKLLVYRAPGKHPGDIHVFEATCNFVLQKVIGSGKYVIYFSTQGPRPIAEEIGKGDLDGDRYWVCKNTQLVSLFKEYPSRWAKPPSTTVPKMLKPADLSPDELEEVLFKEYMKARFSSTSLVGKIANLWLKHMDQFLHSETADKKALHFDAAMKFTPVYYDALDASKTGYTVDFPKGNLPSPKTPHYMNIPGEKMYHSKSIPGQIFDLAKSEELRSYPSYENFKLDETFVVENYKNHFQVWANHFRSYKPEMSKMVSASHLENQGTDRPSSDQIYLKYRKILYGGASSYKDCRRLGLKDPQQVLEEASAIYAVVYASAVEKLDKEAPRLSFVWNVAGEALCSLYAEKQPGKPSFMSTEGLKEYHRKSKKKEASLVKKLFS